MSQIYSDENQIPSLSNESKKRQSCPAQLSQLSQRSFGSILGDSTNMRRSVIDNSKNIFYTQQKESVSSRLSEPVYSHSELKSSSLASKSLIRSSLSRNEVIEEEASQSKLKSSSMLLNSQILREESHISSSQLSQGSSVSKRSSTSNSKESLSLSSQKSSEMLSNDTDRATTSCPKKTISIVQKLIIFLGISLVAFLAVIVGKFFIARAMDGQNSGLSYFIEEQQIKNSYFEQQINNKLKPSTFSKQIEVSNLKESESIEVEVEENYLEPRQVERENEVRQFEEQRSQRSNLNISQLSQSKQEMLINDETEQFFQRLVKVVQEEGRIAYQQFDEFLEEQCTYAIKDKVKQKIQQLVDESVSIKEELDIQTGARFYVSQEKH